MWGESKLKNITLFELFENRKKTIVHIFYICKIQENTKYKKNVWKWQCLPQEIDSLWGGNREGLDSRAFSDVLFLLKIYFKYDEY